MGDSTFRGQDALFSYGWPSAAQAAISEWIPADSIDRYSKVYESIGLTAGVGRADRSGTIGGLTGQIAGPRTSLAPQGTVAVPFALDKFNLGLLAQHAGAAKNEAQQGADTSYEVVISPDETDVDLTTRYPTGLFDKKDGEPQLWLPMGIQQVVWNFTAGDVIKLEYTPVSLGFGFYDTAVTEAGTPTNHAVIRGWLNSTNRALAAASKKLYIKVSSYSSPTATVLAGLGATPVGAQSFSVTAGLDDEGRPRWTEIILDTSAAPGLPIGTADVKMEMAYLDIADVTALDEQSHVNPIASPTKVNPTQPEMTVSSICLTVDGTRVADLTSLTATTVNDLTVVEGGACGAFPQSFRRSGNSTANLEFERGWLTYRHMGDLRDDAQFAVLIEGRSDTLTDSGGALTHQFNFQLEFPICSFADGQTFKTLGAGAGDDTETIGLTAEPDASNPQWKLTAMTDIADIFG